MIVHLYGTGVIINNFFLDVINDAFLEQLITTPTHQNNILDLVFSTHQRISDLSIVPGTYV